MDKFRFVKKEKARFKTPEISLASRTGHCFSSGQLPEFFLFSA
jgi:hypothetical protein